MRSSGAHGTEDAAGRAISHKGEAAPSHTNTNHSSWGFCSDGGKFRGEISQKYKPVMNTEWRGIFFSSWTARVTSAQGCWGAWLWIAATTVLTIHQLSSNPSIQRFLVSRTTFTFSLLSGFVAALRCFAVKWPLLHCPATLISVSYFLAGPSTVWDMQWPGKALGPGSKLMTNKCGAWHAQQQSLHIQLLRNCNYTLAFHPSFTAITQIPLISLQ